MNQPKATLKADLLQREPAQPIVPPARFAAAPSHEGSTAPEQRRLALVTAPRRPSGIGPHITDRRH